jgi:hypothetical protein
MSRQARAKGGSLSPKAKRTDSKKENAKAKGSKAAVNKSTIEKSSKASSVKRAKANRNTAVNNSLLSTITSANPFDNLENVLDRFNDSVHEEEKCISHRQPYTKFNETRDELLCDRCVPSINSSILSIPAAFKKKVSI